MSKQIAPALSRLVLGDKGSLATAYPEAGCELRALKAVYRAAERAVPTAAGGFRERLTPEDQDAALSGLFRALFRARAAKGG